MVNWTALLVTIMLVMVAFPAAFVAVRVRVLAPSASGKSSAQIKPLRSTVASTVVVTPSAPVMEAKTWAVGSSAQPRKVKLLAAIASPFWGQYSVSAGGAMTPLVSNV